MALINMIGRMYRAHRTLFKKGKLTIESKLKSNMGGEKNVKLCFSLVHNASNRSEILEVDITDTELELAVLKEKNSPISISECIDNKWKNSIFKVPQLREILKIISQYKIDEINRSHVVIEGKKMKIYISIDSTFEEFRDLVEITVCPIVIKNKEYLFIDTMSNTPVVKLGNGILFITKKESGIYESSN